MLNFQEKVKLLCEVYGLPPPPETPQRVAILTVADAMLLTVPGERLPATLDRCLAEFGYCTEGAFAHLTRPAFLSRLPPRSSHAASLFAGEEGGGLNVTPTPQAEPPAPPAPPAPAAAAAAAVAAVATAATAATATAATVTTAAAAATAVTAPVGGSPTSPVAAQPLDSPNSPLLLAAAALANKRPMANAVSPSRAQPAGQSQRAEGGAAVFVIDETDESGVPDEWLQAARRFRERRPLDLRASRPFRLLHRPGKGSKQQNGHTDVLVQCLLPGCMASENNIRNEGITMTGGGSALTPSICNFTKHYEKEGHNLNFKAWELSQRKWLEHQPGGTRRTQVSEMLGTIKLISLAFIVALNSAEAGRFYGVVVWPSTNCVVAPKELNFAGKGGVPHGGSCSLSCRASPLRCTCRRDPARTSLDGRRLL